MKIMAKSVDMYFKHIWADVSGTSLAVGTSGFGKCGEPTAQGDIAGWTQLSI